MKSTVMNGEYRSVPIAALTESPTNPRKRFDEKALEELAATFKTQGVLEPLLVRELEERSYQVVIGARRLIAKLPAAQQQEAFAASFRSMWTSEGNTQVLIPVRELAAWIESNILLELAAQGMGSAQPFPSTPYGTPVTSAYPNGAYQRLARSAPMTIPSSDMVCRTSNNTAPRWRS